MHHSYTKISTIITILDPAVRAGIWLIFKNSTMQSYENTSAHVQVYILKLKLPLHENVSTLVIVQEPTHQWLFYTSSISMRDIRALNAVISLQKQILQTADQALISLFINKVDYFWSWHYSDSTYCTGTYWCSKKYSRCALCSWL